jgi:hypothetical protein
MDRRPFRLFNHRRHVRQDDFRNSFFGRLITPYSRLMLLTQGVLRNPNINSQRRHYVTLMPHHAFIITKILANILSRLGALCCTFILIQLKWCASSIIKPDRRGQNPFDRYQHHSLKP